MILDSIFRWFSTLFPPIKFINIIITFNLVLRIDSYNKFIFQQSKMGKNKKVTVIQVLLFLFEGLREWIKRALRTHQEKDNYCQDSWEKENSKSIGQETTQERKEIGHVLWRRRIRRRGTQSC